MHLSRYLIPLAVAAGLVVPASASAHTLRDCTGERQWKLQDRFLDTIQVKYAGPDYCFVYAFPVVEQINAKLVDSEASGRPSKLTAEANIHGNTTASTRARYRAHCRITYKRQSLWEEWAYIYRATVRCHNNAGMRVSFSGHYIY